MTVSLSNAVSAFDDALLGEVAETTRDWYGRRLRGLVEFLGPDTPIDTIHARDIRRWRRYLMERTDKWGGHRPRVHAPLSHNTIDGYIRACKRFFKWLVEEGEIDASPAAKLKGMPRRREEPKPIEELDYRKILKAAENSSPRDLAIVLFFADTGCRREGISNLKLRDIRLDETNQRGSAIVTEKRKKSRRVHFGRATYLAIVAYLRVRPEGHEKLFVGQRGTLSPDGIYQVLKRLAKKAGVTGRYNPHAFRHRFARTVLQNGGNLPVLSRMMGHEDPVITARYYALFADSEMEQWHQMTDPATPVTKDQGTKYP